MNPGGGGSCGAAAIDRGRLAGCLASLDVNLRTRLWSVDEAADELRALTALCDVVMGIAAELALVTRLDADDDPATPASCSARARTEDG